MQGWIRCVGLVFLLLVGACGKESGTNVPKKEAREVRGGSARRALDGTEFNGTGYKLTAPDGWDTKRGFMGMDLMFMSPREGADDPFRENLNVVLENIPPAITKGVYLEATKRNLDTLLTGFVLVAEEVVKLGRHEWHRIEYRMTQGTYDLHNDVYLLLRDGSAYVITCSCLGKDSRARYLPAMRKSIESFTFDE
jgi:hypothetical protein